MVVFTVLAGLGAWCGVAAALAVPMGRLIAGRASSDAPEAPAALADRR